LEQGRKEQLLELEQRAIDLCEPSYNILIKAGSSLGFKHALETLANMSEIKKGELNPIFGRSPQLSFSKFIEPKPVYHSVNNELLKSFPEGIVVAKKTLNMGYDTLKRLCNSNPKEVFTPRKGSLQSYSLST
jgi:hypothetical protein